jgi:hypothetical protein
MTRYHDTSALYREIEAADFGVDGDGSTDNAVAFSRLSAFVNAIGNADGSPVVVVFRRGRGKGVYVYSDGLTFSRPVILTGLGGTTLDYTGTGYAVKLGPDGLDDTTYRLHQRYGVDGLRFTGGDDMVHGLYFNDHVTEPRVLNCTFDGFGNADSYALFFQADNWDILLDRCDWYTPSTDTVARNFVRVRGRSVADVSDNGNSRLRMLNCHATNLNTGGGTGSGVGVWLNGVNNQIINCKIEGFEPDVRLGSLASKSRIVNNYFEIIRINGASACIEYGDPSGGDSPSTFLTELVIEDNYFNCHNADSINIDAYAIGYTTTSTGFANNQVNRNHVASYDSTRELVRQPDKAQSGNEATGNTGIGKVHTSGGSITEWGGTQGLRPLFKGLRDASNYLRVGGGVSADQNAGVLYEGYNGSQKALTYFGPGASRFYIQHIGGNKFASLDSSGNWRADGKVLATGGLGVGNDVAATTLGSVARKMEVFDETGASLGFVPIYDSIT